MTVEELQQNKELFEQCGKEIEAKVQTGEDHVSAAIEVFKTHGVKVDEDALKAEAVGKINLSMEELDHVSGGTDVCWSDHACHYIYCHDDGEGEEGEACFNNYECIVTFHRSSGSNHNFRR